MTTVSHIDLNMHRLELCAMFNPYCPECGYFQMQVNRVDDKGIMPGTSLFYYSCPNCKHEMEKLHE